MIEADAQFPGLEFDAFGQPAELDLKDACGHRHRDAPEVPFFFGAAQRFEQAGKSSDFDFGDDLAQRLAYKAQERLAADEKGFAGLCEFPEMMRLAP